MISVMSFFAKKRLFLDYASTTPVSQKVELAMNKAKNFSANPSALYSEAISAKDLLKEARSRVADALNAQSKEILFTSGGTEGNNMALLGIFEAHRKNGFTPHFIVSEIEHPAILEVCGEIVRRGGEVTKIKVDEDGIVKTSDIRENIKSNTVLISIMYANNEIGTIQPVKEIARIVKEYRRSNETALPYIHTDACQASLYLDIEVLKLGVDMMTQDGIKMYGPRGAGVLFVKDGVKIHPIMFGGGQEKGLRSGTEDLTRALGMAEALEVALAKRESEYERLSDIRDYGIEKILKEFPQASLNGSQKERLPNNINICFPDLDAEFAVISLDVLGICASYSSSCMNLKEDSSSYVVESLGKKDCSNSSLRFTLGRETKKADMDTLVSALKKVVK